MIHHRDLFCELDEKIKKKVKFADNRLVTVTVEGVGKVEI